MDTVSNIVIALVVFTLILGLIVFIHELGHFLACKKVGVLVQEFAFGFGPKVYAKRYKGTLYRINLFPLGGYVRMLGDQDGSSFLRYTLKKSDPKDDQFALDLFKKENINLKTKNFSIIEKFMSKQANILPKEEYQKLQNYVYYNYIPKHEGNYDNKTGKQRALILSAGVIMNLLLAIVLFYIFFIGQNFVTDLKKLGNPLLLGTDVSMPIVLSEVYSTDNSIVNSIIIRKFNDELITSKAQFLQFMKDNYNIPIKITYQKFNNGYSEVMERTLILNGDNVVSSLDEDVFDSIYVGTVSSDSIADKIGIKTGNYLIQIGGSRISSSTNISEILLKYVGQKIQLSYSDNQGIIRYTEFTVPPAVDNKVVFGISYDFNYPLYDDILHLDYGNQKLFSGIFHTINMTMYNFSGLAELIKQSITQRSINPVSQGLSSPVGVSGIVYELVKVDDYANIINLAGLVSLSLGVMNVLPIPLFDGGHLMFLILEKLRGKKISESKQENISTVAFYIIVGLSVVIIFKDIIQFEFINKVFNLISGIFK